MLLDAYLSTCQFDPVQLFVRSFNGFTVLQRRKDHTRSLNNSIIFLRSSGTFLLMLQFFLLIKVSYRITGNCATFRKWMDSLVTIDF